jgi:hypothetical protein
MKETSYITIFIEPKGLLKRTRIGELMRVFYNIVERLYRSLQGRCNRRITLI